MPAATRLDDICTGHGCFSSRPSVTASTDVKINGKGAVRVDDKYAAHGCGVCVPHGGMLAEGSGTVYVNGRAAGRVDDPIDCGGMVKVGSPDVNFGD